MKTPHLIWFRFSTQLVAAAAAAAAAARACRASPLPVQAASSSLPLAHPHLAKPLHQQLGLRQPRRRRRARKTSARFGVSGNSSARCAKRTCGSHIEITPTSLICFRILSWQIVVFNETIERQEYGSFTSTPADGGKCTATDRAAQAAALHQKRADESERSSGGGGTTTIRGTASRSSSTSSTSSTSSGWYVCLICQDRL